MRSITVPGAFWDKIAKALPWAGGTWNLLGLRVRALNGELDVIEFGESVLVAEVVEYSTGLVAYRAIAGSGTWNDLDGMMKGLLEGAERRGASRIEIFGRRGWERKLQGVGFKHLFTVMVKEV